jgi:hypothetical protein
VRVVRAIDDSRSSDVHVRDIAELKLRPTPTLGPYIGVTEEVPVATVKTVDGASVFPLPTADAISTTAVAFVLVAVDRRERRVAADRCTKSRRRCPSRLRREPPTRYGDTGQSCRHRRRRVHVAIVSVML